MRVCGEEWACGVCGGAIMAEFRKHAGGRERARGVPAARGARARGVEDGAVEWKHGAVGRRAVPAWGISRFCDGVACGRAGVYPSRVVS